MKFENADCTLETDEFDLCQEILPILGAEVLEIGCGRGEMAQRFVQAGAARVIALEANQKKYAENLNQVKIPGLQFGYGRAEELEFGDSKFDLVTLFKSFHHVPEEYLMKALFEIRRVLRKKGIAYISEPIAKGPFNDLIAIFHNEKKERQNAFQAICEAETKKMFTSVKQYFFYTKIEIKNFEEFELKYIKPICTDKALSTYLRKRLKDEFGKSCNENGSIFKRQMRVDVLTK